MAFRVGHTRLGDRWQNAMTRELFRTNISAFYNIIVRASVGVKVGNSHVLIKRLDNHAPTKNEPSNVGINVP